MSGWGKTYKIRAFFIYYYLVLRIKQRTFMLLITMERL